MSQQSIGPKVNTGVRLNLHPEDPNDFIHLQRSDDGTTSTIEREWRVPGTRDQIQDILPPTAGTKFYRTRGIGRTDCVDPSTWTPWRQARASVLFETPNVPKTPVAREMPFKADSPFHMEQKTGLIGQLWRIGSTSSLNFRSYDGTTGDGVVTVEWDACEFWNGGESIAIDSGKSTEAAPETEHFLYHDAEGGDETLTTNEDNISDWPHMFLGDITSASEGSTQGSTGETSGSTGGPLKT